MVCDENASKWNAPKWNRAKVGHVKLARAKLARAKLNAPKWHVIVVHDVSGCAALYHFEFMDVGGCVRVPDDAGIF